MKRALLRKSVARLIPQGLASARTATTASKLVDLHHHLLRPTAAMFSSWLIKKTYFNDPVFSIHMRAMSIIHGPPRTSPSLLFDDNDDNDLDDSDAHQNADYHYPLNGPNPGLASIISQGSKSLEQSAADIEYRTRNASLSQPHKKGSFRAGTLEPRQLAEGQRILDTAVECLEVIIEQAERGGLTEGQRKGLILSGEPIVLLECVVNRNIKQAKLYWTLPYGILMDDRIHYHQHHLYQQITAKVQQQLVEGGGARLLAGHVHARLSSYYPPRIKMMPATDDMVIRAIEEYNL